MKVNPRCSVMLQAMAEPPMGSLVASRENYDSEDNPMHVFFHFPDNNKVVHRLKMPLVKLNSSLQVHLDLQCISGTQTESQSRIKKHTRSKERPGKVGFNDEK